jgi:hypothetical protein
MTIQFKVALGDDLRSWLDGAAEKSGKSLADEIRDRVISSFVLERMGPQTKELVYSLAILADEVQQDVGTSWFESERARAALIAAITDQIMSYQLTPKRKAPNRPTGSDLNDPPDVIGRAIARKFRRQIEDASTSLSALARFLP